MYVAFITIKEIVNAYCSKKIVNIYDRIYLRFFLLPVLQSTFAILFRVINAVINAVNICDLFIGRYIWAWFGWATKPQLFMHQTGFKLAVPNPGQQNRNFLCIK